MSRLLLTGFGVIVSFLSFWILCGSAAAIIGSRGSGAREGAGAMGGFFFIGPMFGVAGAIAGGWLVWRLLANPAWNERVGFTLVGVLVALVVGVFVAMQPTYHVVDDYPGRKAELEVEVRFPAGAVDAIEARDNVQYELRAGDGTEHVSWKRDQMRREGDRTIVPASFPTRQRPRTKLLAVMKNDEQLMCYTLNVDGELDRTTEWSPWQPMEAGTDARWRLLVRDAK